MCKVDSKNKFVRHIYALKNVFLGTNSLITLFE